MRLGGGGGGSPQSSGASEKLSAALAAPSGLTATVKSATEITLSWSATTNATFYEVYRGSSSNSANSTKKSDKTLTTTSYTSTGLTPRTDYYYWLKACNSSGCSGFSTDVNETPREIRFITTWEVKDGDLEITIPTHPDFASDYNYNVDCDDDSTDNAILTNQMGDATCPYAKAGTYTVAIIGDFPAIYFNNAGDKDKILTVENWGTISWKTMENAFFTASNFTLTATDTPDLLEVTNMRRMFLSAFVFNQDISGWNVSKVTDMGYMLSTARAFNQDISKWNVSNVTTMESMFSGATVFNSDISKWNVSNVTNMGGMFLHASAFNQDISGWNVSKVMQCNAIFISSGMDDGNRAALKDMTNGWLRPVGDGGLPTGSGCRTTISGL